MNENKTFTLADIDAYSLLMDLLHNLWAAVLGALAVAMALYMFNSYRHVDRYTCSATFAVMSKKSSNYIYQNLNAAENMAETFTGVLQSDVLKERVCTDLGIDEFNASVKASVVSETNILILSVTDESPQDAFNVIRTIINDYPDLIQWASSSMVMNILQEPEVPRSPDNPLYMRNSTIRIFGLSLLAFLALFAEFSIKQDTIKKEKDLTDKLDAKSLGTVNYEKKYKSLSSRLRDKKTGLKITDTTASFGFVESYRKIAAKIIDEAGRKHANAILITSVREHEGKSTAAVNIALTLARQGKNVVLIDGDLRSPSIAEMFDIDVDPHRTLYSMLFEGVKPANALYRDKKSGLYLLLSHKGYSNSTEIIASDRMKKAIKMLKEAADYVVLDSPPVSVIADAAVEANLTDLSVLVVQYNRVQASDINETIDVLKECKAELAGCVLNQVRTISHSMVGGYGYGGYRYGYGKYGTYGKYGKYGHYGKYGKYGKYDKN
ncbi:MAG: polysaccharide biosynthesis tyrosine autokinase [Erysipelotrichaceae bacterium]|nr:polysaccharide biosynthesis tyrosine autokinase [Erysipelotrichaceae bacterium]